MDNGKRIPTPLKYRWRRFRYNALPVLSFLACVGVTLWLWDRQGQMPNAVGEVEPVRLPVTAGTDGKLVDLSWRPWWSLFEDVEAGTVIARLDDTLAKAEVVTLQLELDGLGKEFEAAVARLRLEEEERQHDRLRETIRLVVQAERTKLDVMDREIDIARLGMELERLNKQYKIMESLQRTQPGAITEFDMTDHEAQQDVVDAPLERSIAALKEARKQANLAERRRDEHPDEVKRRIAETAKALADAEEHWRKLQQDREAYVHELESRFAEKADGLDEGVRRYLDMMRWQEAYPSLDADRLTSQLAPVLASMGTLRSRIHQAQLQIDALEIRAPIPGRICKIDSWPGQNVRAGDPILTIASDVGRYAVAYIRQEQRIYPEVDMIVDIRARVPGSRPEAVKVEEVGSQYEAIPLHLLRDPRVPEWGLPVRISLPSGFSVRPGELIDIRFKSQAKERAG
jgi:multidrug resistance efflux pump